MNTLTGDDAASANAARQQRLDAIDSVKKNIRYYKPGEKQCYTTPLFEPVMYVAGDLGYFWMISEVTNVKEGEQKYFLTQMGGSDWTSTENNIIAYKALQTHLLRLFSMSDILYAIGIKKAESAMTNLVS